MKAEMKISIQLDNGKEFDLTKKEAEDLYKTLGSLLNKPINDGNFLIDMLEYPAKGVSSPLPSVVYSAPFPNQDLTCKE